MGCIEASAHTTGTILGTYSSLEDCEQQCGVCCIPGCGSDFAQINVGDPNFYTGELSVPEYYWQSYFIPDCKMFYYGSYPNSLTTSGGINNNTGGVDTSGYYAVGWCPANFPGGYFENSYDCSSSRHEYVRTSIPGELEFDIANYNIGDPIIYHSDPCEGVYPCTGSAREITSSNIFVQKNPVLWASDYSPESIFGGETRYSMSYFAYWDYSLAYFFYNCTVPYTHLYNNGYWRNYFWQDIYTEDPVPVCGDPGTVIASGAAYDVVSVIRFSSSSKSLVTIDYHQDGYSYISKKEWVHSRKHDIHLFICDSTSGTMTDISGDGSLDFPMPFYYPWDQDNIDWASYGYCGYNIAYPGNIMGFPYGWNYYYAPYNGGPTTNAIVGTLRQGDPATVYGVEVAGPGGNGSNGSIITESFSGPLGNSTITPVALPEFLPLPNINGDINVTYSCNDTISQSGCSEQLSAVWHSGQNCTTFDCNA